MERRHHPLWYASTYRLESLDSTRARDLMVDCFTFSQKPTFRAVKERMGLTASDDALRRSAENAVRLAFRQAGADYDHPTSDNLLAVVEILANKSALWGTPPYVVEHHLKEMRRVVGMIR